jgi:bifunctional DNA-binding transcriptional regulator/antitoxin component of YhaV-PrlF toxin-antitoxin module
MSRNVSKEISAMGDAEIDSRGRFAIPKTVRETIGIKKQVSWFSYGNCLVIIPRQHLFEELMEKIRKAVLGDDRRIEDIESKLPQAGEGAFRKRYGDELTDRYLLTLATNDVKMKRSHPKSQVNNSIIPYGGEIQCGTMSKSHVGMNCASVNWKES